MHSTPGRADSPFRIAVVGCGAVTSNSLLPVLAGHEHVRIVALVDRDRARAQALADAYGLSGVATDTVGITRADVDGVVLATPPAHHAPATLELIARGLHVFVEKPMATRLEDAEAMVAAAARQQVALSVGLYRRLLPVTRLLRGLLEGELLGRPVSVDIEEGGEYSWELATLTVLTREGGGGGVLIDLGSHLLDQLCFLLPGTVALKRYADNARGGVETDCEIDLELSTRWGLVPAAIRLSRTRQLRGSVRVECEGGTLELLRGDFCSLLVHTKPGTALDAVAGAARPVTVTAAWSDEREIVGYKAFRNELDDWIAAATAGREPELSGRSVLQTVRVVDECYRSPTPLPEPWTDGGLASTALAARGAPAIVSGTRPRVLVTGAGGFVGCRTVECLHMGQAWDVRALVRRPGSAARLARLPVEIVLGDVSSADDMARAMQGCDAVVHCAVGTGWPPEAAFAVTVDGTRTVADQARAARVRRFVHISSMAVHGDHVPGRLDETAPLDPGTGADYGRAKYLAEQAVDAAAAQGLAAITLRPARIYGPYSRTFTVRPLQALGDGGIVLSGDAESPANMVFVDNVVEAIVCALGADEAALSQAFLISEPDQVSWRAFYEFFRGGAGAAIQVVPRPGAGQAESPTLGRRWATGVRDIALSPEVRGLAKRVLWTDPIGTWPRRWWERSPALQRRVQKALRIDAAVTYRQAAPPPPQPLVFDIHPTDVVFDKAARLLGYRGVVARDQAMAITKDWARWAGLV
jgi:predicted dehydrogenase/nucleoside-diphosphate-sugar epimerase